jgi:hypothetical protein
MRYANRTALALRRTAEHLVGHGRSSGNDRNGLIPASRSVRVVDAVNDERDWLPGILDSIQQVFGALRHPRSVLRSAIHGD